MSVLKGTGDNSGSQIIGIMDSEGIPEKDSHVSKTNVSSNRYTFHSPFCHVPPVFSERN